MMFVIISIVVSLVVDHWYHHHFCYYDLVSSFFSILTCVLFDNGPFSFSLRGFRLEGHMYLTSPCLIVSSNLFFYWSPTLYTFFNSMPLFYPILQFYHCKISSGLRFIKKKISSGLRYRMTSYFLELHHTYFRNW